jgi:class 3 adenylate cyclase
MLNKSDVLERARDLEQVHRIVNQMGESFGECIARFGGTPHPSSVHEFTAVFGAPETRDNDPERAIRAALDFAGAVGELGERQGVELALGVGIDCGEAIVSTSSRSGPRVTGMPMTTARRIARASGESQVVISQRLRDSIASRFACEEEELVVGSGQQTERLRVWKVAGPSDLGKLGTSKFVGRRRELRQVEGILNSSLEDGGGGVVYIRGGPLLLLQPQHQEIGALAQHDAGLFLATVFEFQHAGPRPAASYPETERGITCRRIAGRPHRPAGCTFI